jgi:hypothetical protein
MNLLESFATAVFSKPDRWGFYFIPVKVINPKNNKSTTVQMKVDTGAYGTRIDSKVAEKIGLDVKVGQKMISGPYPVYEHKVKLQVGSLKPVTALTIVQVEPMNYYLLGWNSFIDQYRFEASGNNVKFTELAALAMANSTAYFRSKV